MGSFTYQASITIAMIANGTLTRKTQRQPKLGDSVRYPPMIGTGHAGKSPDRAEESLHACTLLQGEEIPEHREHDGPDCAGTESLDGPHGDQLAHRHGRTREDRTQREKDQAEEQNSFATIEIRELAVNRRADGRGEQVGRDDPGVNVEAAKLGDDRRHGRRDDQLLHGGDRHGHEQRGGDHATAGEGGLASRLTARASVRLNFPTRRLHDRQSLNLVLGPISRMDHCTDVEKWDTGRIDRDRGGVDPRNAAPARVSSESLVNGHSSNWQYRKERAMNRPEQESDRPEQSSRRGMLKQTAAAGAAVAALGIETSAQETQSAERSVKNGRIKQSIVYWCFEPYWDFPKAIKVAKQLGCVSIELMAPKFFPLLKQAGLTCAIGTIDMGTDPPFVKGFNNPKYWERVIKATRDSIDACAEYGFKNVICFTGMREGIPDDVGADNCVEGFKQIVGHAEKKGVTLCLEMLNSRVSSAPHEGPSRLPGRPHRLLHRHHQASRFAQPETALRHLSRPDHGRRRHHPDSPVQGLYRATSTRRATPAAASSTTSRKSTTRRSWKPCSRSAIRAMSARSSSRPATRRGPEAGRVTLRRLNHPPEKMNQGSHR